MRRLLLVLLAVSGAGTASAEPAEIRLEAPVGCPDLAGLRRLVDEHAGGAAPAIAARVRVHGAGDEWTAVVELGDASVRQIEGATCAEVLDAAALVISLASDDHPDPISAPDPVPVPAPDPVTISQRATATRPATGLGFRAGLAGDTGTMPEAAVAAVVAASLWRGAYGAEIAFAAYHRSMSTLDGSEVAPIGLWTAGLRGCRRAWVLAACAGGEVGPMTGHAGALSGGNEATGVWSAVGASAWLRRPVAANLGLFGGLEAMVAMTRPRFALDDGAVLHGAGPLALRAVIGIDLEMP